MKGQNKNKISNPVKFLALMVFLYFLLLIFYPEFCKVAFANFLYILIRVVPLLGVVFLVMFLVDLFIDQNKIRKFLGKASGIKGWIFSVFAGILISGPPYMLYPMLGEMKKQGATDKLLAVFLYNRNVKIPFIPVMIFYFGLAYTVTISVLIIVFSFLNGALVEVITSSGNSKKI